MFLLLLMLLPVDDPDLTTPLFVVDRIEKNYLYDGRGQLVLVQYLGWIWHDDRRSYHVAFWMLERNVRYVTHNERSTLLTTWRKDTLVRVRSPVYVETGTFDDPELADRQALRKHERRTGQWFK